MAPLPALRWHTTPRGTCHFTGGAWGALSARARQQMLPGEEGHKMGLVLYSVVCYAFQRQQFRYYPKRTFSEAAKGCWRLVRLVKCHLVIDHLWIMVTHYDAWYLKDTVLHRKINTSFAILGGKSSQMVLANRGNLGISRNVAFLEEFTHQWVRARDPGWLHLQSLWAGTEWVLTGWMKHNQSTNGKVRVGRLALNQR